MGVFEEIELGIELGTFGCDSVQSRHARPEAEEDYIKSVITIFSISGREV